MDWVTKFASEPEDKLEGLEEGSAELEENVLVGPPCECGGLDANELIVEP